MFKDNYAGKYDKTEFLIDADIEFTKIKRLLEKHPKTLRDDPILATDYFKIIGLIKQKKLLENTSDHFDPENQFLTAYNDPNMIQENEDSKRRERMARASKRVSIAHFYLLSCFTVTYQLL